MVFITIVTGAYKPTYILGASHCTICVYCISFLLRSSRKKTPGTTTTTGSKRSSRPQMVAPGRQTDSALTNGGCNPIYRCLIFTLHFSLQLLQIRQDFAWALDDLNHIAFRERAELDVTRSSMDWLNGFFFCH